MPTIPPVQKTSGNVVATSLAVAFVSPNTLGNFLWYGWSHLSGADTATDTNNTLNNDVALAGTAFVESAIHSVPNCAGGSNTLTITGAGSQGRSAIIAEYAGVATVTPFDKTASATGSGVSPNSGASPATTQADELVIGFCASDSASASPYTVGAGYTAEVDLAAGNRDAFFEDKIVAATGAQTATCTSSNTGWRMSVVTYKLAAALSAAQQVGSLSQQLSSQMVGIQWK